jgi:CDP-L-myo-inositol myo-inositolphosphotransferase
VARATFRASPAGARLDTAIDTMTTLLFVIGLAINLSSSGHPEAVRFAVWGLGLFLFGLALIAWRAASSGGSFDFHWIKHHYRDRYSGALVPRFIAFATLVTSRDFFALFFAVLTVGGLPMVVLYLFAAAASLWILFVAGSVFSARVVFAPEKV